MKDIYISKINLLTLLTKELDNLLKRYAEVKDVSDVLIKVTGKQDFALKTLKLWADLIQVNVLKKEMVKSMNSTRVLFRVSIKSPTEDVFGLDEYITNITETESRVCTALEDNMVMDLRNSMVVQLTGEAIMTWWLGK